MKFFSNKRKEHTLTAEDAQVDQSLAQLYTAEEPPPEMPAQFQRLLAQREVARPAVQRGAVARPSRRLAFAGIGGVVAAAAGLAVVAALVLPGSGGRSGGVAEALQFLQAIPDRFAVGPGDVLYIRTEVYDRHGRKAAEIATHPEALTESHVRESWLEIGSDESIVRSFARVLDSNGVVVQEARAENGVLRAVDPRTGEEIGVAELPAQSIQDTAGFRAERYEQALLNGTAEIVVQDEDRITLRFTEVVPREIREQEFGAGEFSLSFYHDLDPIEFITLETLAGDGTMPEAERYVLTGSGEMVLIQSAHSVYAILDAMP